ncbi:UNVERIFIED_CONTAM: hypothetical protein Slati_0925400 [Sesamum latifolium]|uniref:Uncharacterized protein n=1 Tax=Sesamum latifolium TaxID=2727402 RepID=A0AAW2XNY8_9LAMI
MCHPSDVEAWKHFDQSYPDFAAEPRNVRLAMCTDGFAPHGQYGRTYSCWPVILTPYNLPPGMCMKPEYMFLTMNLFSYSVDSILLLNNDMTEAVSSYLGKKSMWVAGIFLQESYYGYGIAYTITSAISMRYPVMLSMSVFLSYDLRRFQLLKKKSAHQLSKTASPVVQFHQSLEQLHDVSRVWSTPLGRGRGRELGQVVRPPTLDVSDALEASTHPIVPPPDPPSIPTASESQSVDSMQFTTSSAATPPTARSRAHTYISGDDILSFGPLHAPMVLLQRHPRTPKIFWFEELKHIYRWDCPEHEEAQLGRPPQRMEVFAACYKKKDDGNWSCSRAEEVVETYQKMLEEHASQLTPPEEGGSSAASVTPLEEEQLWIERLGEKACRVFGMGFEALTSNATRTWTKDHRASTSSAASPPEPPVSTQLQEIKLMLGILFNKMGIQMLRPDQAPATDAPAEESIQEAADP